MPSIKMIRLQLWDARWYVCFGLPTTPFRLTSPKATLPVDVKLAKVGLIRMGTIRHRGDVLIDDDSGSHVSLSGTYSHSCRLSLIQTTLSEPD